MRRHKFNTARKFEKLEDRRMMAGDVTFANGILTIDGTNGNDVVDVRFEEDTLHVDVTQGDIEFEDDGLEEDGIAIQDVTKIVFNGIDGNDTLTVLVENLDSEVSVAGIELDFYGGNHDDSLYQFQGGIKTTTADGGAGNDILEGSRFSDVFEGGAGNDQLFGKEGDDTYIFAGTALGMDMIYEAPNADTDTLDLANLASGAWVDLSYMWGQGQFNVAVDSQHLSVLLDNATAIENVIGTAFSDWIAGNSRRNHLMGGGQIDDITGAGGDDTLEGGAGSDIYHFAGTNLGTDEIVEVAGADSDGLDFSNVSQGLTIDLTKVGANYAVNSTALRLKLSNDTAIEKVWGTDFDDKITGNGRDNYLYGKRGNDTISGGIGTDYLSGGEGMDKFRTDALDTVFGGAGIDTFDGSTEYYFLSNPRPSRYRDWGVI